MRTWWAAQSRGVRITVGIVGAIVGLNLLLGLVGRVVGREPGGPPSSSYATGPDGLAGLARLYEDVGHPVERARDRLADLDLEPGSLVVTVDPADLLEDDVEAMRDLVTGGGRVLAAGSGALQLGRELAGGGLRWSPDGLDVATVRLPVAEAPLGAVVRGDGEGSWTDVGAGVPFLGSSGRTTGFVVAVGAGRAVLLADVTPLQNDHLAEGDIAALALASAGDGPVVFDEASHGYGASGGVLPGRWWALLALGLVATLLLMWTAAKRLGPPELPGRELPPARRQYVDALAVSLSRTGEPAAAVAGLQRRARRRLTDRLGLGPDAGRAEVEAAAGRAGLPADDVAALFETPRSAAEVTEVGRAAARYGGDVRVR